MEKNLPQKYNGIFESPMTYGMKFSFRLKGEKEIQNLWFENKTIPAFLGYMIRAKMFDWYEWKSTKAMVPSGYTPKEPLIQQIPVLPPNNGEGYKKSCARGISYSLSFIFAEDSEVHKEIFQDEIPWEYLGFIKPLCDYWEVQESLMDLPPVKKQVSFVMEHHGLCICHETGIKFAVDLSIPAKFHFDMLHPLAVKNNIDNFLKHYMVRGEDLDCFLEPQILAGIIISLLKNAKLFHVHELSAQACNEKLIRECSPEFMAIFIKWFAKQKSYVGFPSFHLAGDFRFDWQLMNFLRIMKGEDTTVGHGKSSEAKAFNITLAKSEKPKVSTISQIEKDLKDLIDGMQDELPKEYRLFLCKLKAKIKNIGLFSQEHKDAILVEVESTLPLNSKVEKFLEILEAVEIMDFTDEKTEKEEPAKFNLMGLLTKKIKGDKDE